MNRVFRNTVMIIIVIAILSACGGRGQRSESFQMKMASWSQPITEQANLYAAEEKGWFSDKGIDFSFIPGAGGGDAIKNIISGQADIAFTDAGSLYFALDQGAELVSIYNIYPQSVFNVVSLKESGLNQISDLKGKTIGVYSLSSGTYHNLLVLLHHAGLTEDDVTIVETGVLNFAPLMQGQVDATAATDTGLMEAMLKDIGEVNVIEVKDYLNIPSDLFVVTKQVYENRKDELRTFLEVYRDSAEWMIQYPEEAAAVAKDKAIDGQDEVRNLEIIKLRNAATVDDNTDRYGLGALDVSILQQGADLFHELGLIKNTLNLAETVRTDLLPTGN